MEKPNELHSSDSRLLSFNPVVILRDALKHWLLVLLIAVIVGIGAYILTDMSYEPVYQTRTTFVVTTRSSTNTVYSNLSSTSTLATVFSEVLNSSVLRKTVLAEAGLGSFNGTISARPIAETNLLTLRVTASDPRTAFLVTRAIIENHESLTYEVVGNITLEVLQNPTVPMSPTTSSGASHRMKEAMILAAMAMFALLALLSYNRDTIRSDREAKDKLDCRFLGTIPHENKYKTLKSWIRHQKTSILISKLATSFHFVENIRKLRRKVERHMDGGKVLMVTSLLENEGKSTVAANLALAMAKKHNRVLLLECDLRKPACATILNQKWVSASVRDVLSGKVAPEDAIIQDRTSGLHLLLETKRLRNAAELASSDAMRNLVAWARDHFDFVIMDLPPMSVASDAEGVMDFVDGSLLVVRQNAGKTPALNKAIATLNRGKAKMLGCVLNNVYTSFLSGHGFSSYGKYGEYGKYGHYDSYTENSSGS